MKKIIVLLLSFFIFSNVKAITASSYVAIDMDSGRVLIGEKIHDERLIASITKIVTCIIVIENTDLEKEITVGNEVLKAYGSAIYIEAGEKIKIKDLLYGLMLRSGNDAAIVLAKNVSGSMEEFVKLMNQKVQDLKLKNTSFINNNGLEEKDKENKSSAYDMAILTKYAMNNNTFREIFQTKNYKVTTNYKTYLWHNKNRLIHQESFITGGKTGYTLKAKRTLVTTASKDDKNVIIVTLNDGNDFEDHLNLYKTIFNNYEKIKVLDNTNFIISNCKYKDYYINDSFEVLVTSKEAKMLKTKIELEKNIINKVIGKVKVYLDEELIFEEPIFYKKDNIKVNIFTKIKNWILSW